MYQVLLTTSGIGSRLGNLTKYTNKSLTRVGNKPAISRILDKYPKETEIVVTLGHFGQHVKDFLELTYPDRTFNFVNIDNYDGPGSSLVYSILQARSSIKGPFIFHTCDTLLYGDEIPLPDHNWLGGSKEGDNSKYASINLSDNIVSTINEKGENSYDFLYIGLSGILEWEKFFNYLQEIYENNPQNGQLSDIHALKKMITNGIEFSCKEFKTWLDIGNIESLKKAKIHYPEGHEILDKPNESIFILDNKVIKFFSDESIIKQRVDRALLLSPNVPEIIGHRNNFYCYKYVEGTLISRITHVSLIYKLLQWADNNIWSKTFDNTKEFYDACKNFYIEKTNKRISSFLEKRGLTDKGDIINGKVVPNISSQISSIPLDILLDGKPCMFHGDFILDNILYDGKNFILIDWRHDFGGLQYGDMYYDLAKLNHNLHFNHDIINSGGYKIDTKNNEITVDLNIKYSLINGQIELNNFIKSKNLNQKKVNILTPLIWINMAPLHEYPLDLFLYYFGRLVLQQEIDKLSTTHD